MEKDAVVNTKNKEGVIALHLVATLEIAKALVDEAQTSKLLTTKEKLH